MPHRLIARIRRSSPEARVRVVMGYIVIVTSVTALIVGIGAQGSATSVRQDSADRAQAVRAGQIQNCKVLGEPVRRAVVALLRVNVSSLLEKVARSKHFDYKTIFPGASPRALKRAIRKQNGRDRDTAQELQRIASAIDHPLPCAKRYPPLPGT